MDPEGLRGAGSRRWSAGGDGGFQKGPLTHFFSFLSFPLTHLDPGGEGGDNGRTVTVGLSQPLHTVLLLLHSSLRGNFLPSSRHCQCLGFGCRAHPWEQGEELWIWCFPSQPSLAHPHVLNGLINRLPSAPANEGPPCSPDYLNPTQLLLLVCG